MRALFGFPWLAALAALAPLATSSAQAPDFWLEIGGSAGVGFSGTCHVRRAEVREAETVAIEARVPYRRGFSGRAVDCELRSRDRGRLVVTLRNAAGNSISRSAMSGPAGRVVRMSVSRSWAARPP